MPVCGFNRDSPDEHQYEAHRSDFPGFPEGPFVLMTGRLQSEAGVAFSAPKCLVLLRIWTCFRRQVSLNA